MLLDALKRFRQKTYERYEQEHRDEILPWMEKVNEIHERSHFLFYFDDFADEKEVPFSVEIVGETVRDLGGFCEQNATLYLYSGEADLLAVGRVLSRPEDQEEGSRRLLHRKKDEFTLEILSFKGYPAEKTDRRQKMYCLQILGEKLSLISDYDISVQAKAE